MTTGIARHAYNVHLRNIVIQVMLSVSPGFVIVVVLLFVNIAVLQDGRRCLGNGSVSIVGFRLTTDDRNRRFGSASFHHWITAVAATVVVVVITRIVVIATVDGGRRITILAMLFPQVCLVVAIDISVLLL